MEMLDDLLQLYLAVPGVFYCYCTDRVPCPRDPLVLNINILCKADPVLLFGVD